MYILGTNLSHDGSACLVESGTIAAAIAEERLDGTKRSSLAARVRKKGQSGRVPPLRAITYCLAARNIGLDDVDLIVADNAIEPVNTDSLRALLPVKDKTKIRSLPHPSHHLAHAYSTFFCSPFDESAILIADVFGSQTMNGTEAESGYHASGNVIRPVFKNFQSLWLEANPHQRVYYSLTYVYNFISIALGFGEKNRNAIFVSEAGKTMGLSAYGRSRQEWPAIIECHNDDIQSHRFTQWALDRQIATIRNGALVPVRRPSNAKLSELHHDLAYAAQAELEKGMLFLAHRLHDLTGSKNLCLAGGAGLNSIINRKILDETPFENIFIQPASTDDGTAIGCAMYGWHELAQQKTRFRLTHAYLGVPYDRAAVQTALKSRGMGERVVPDAELICHTARQLAAGRVVGWFQGGSEFGPRALGHRSILGDPRRAGIKNLINRKVKHREAFRPYAPVVLAEFAADFFKLPCPSPYMLFVASVLKSKASEIAGVIHVDGTARVQTVTEDSNRLLYRLVKEFHRVTGVPILVNTSFNTRGMPIVETPDDALDLFFDSQMDVLVIDNFICDKAEKGPMLALARHYEGHQKPDRALALIQKAVRKWPDDRSLSPLLTKCHYANGNYRDAIDAGLMCDSPAYGTNLHLILGMSYEKNRDFQKAVPELKEAEKLDPDNDEINVALTRCYRATNQTELMDQEIIKGYNKVLKRLKGLF